MCLIQDNNLVVEQVGVINTLPDENTVSYVPNLGIFFCFVIESDRIPHLFPQFCSSLLTDPISHTNRSHTPRLRTYNLNLLNGLNRTFHILLHQILMLDDRFLKIL